jgi:hypothetical protein
LHGNSSLSAPGSIWRLIARKGKTGIHLCYHKLEWKSRTFRHETVKPIVLPGGAVMLKTNTKLRIILLVGLYSLIILGIGYAIAILIANYFDYSLQDVMFIEGMIIFVLGIMLSMKGNPSGSFLSGFGLINGQYFANLNLEITSSERKSTNYYKNFLKNSIVEVAFSNLTIIIGGIFIVLFALFAVI